MAFTASDVKALREKTGVGMMDCKKALVESDGDMDKAIDFLSRQALLSRSIPRPISLQRTISSRALFSALLRLL